MKRARAQLLCTAQLAGEELQRDQPIRGLSELCTKLRCSKRTYIFTTYLVSLSIKASEAGITATPAKISPWRALQVRQAATGSTKHETQDLKEEKDPVRMGGGREQVTSTQKPKLGMN